MNLIKNFRKPCFAIVLASLTLFASCSQYDNEAIETPNLAVLTNNLNLANYLERHLQISAEITILLESENNIDTESLQYAKENLKPEEILGMLEDANIQQSDDISKLFIQMNNNNNFANSNPHLKNLNYSEIENMISVEIDNQLDQFQRKASGSCRNSWNTSYERCNRNFLTSLAAVGISGFFTLGIGTAIGAGAAILILALCKSDTDEDYMECMGYNNNNQ